MSPSFKGDEDATGRMVPGGTSIWGEVVVVEPAVVLDPAVVVDPDVVVDPLVESDANGVESVM
jgi:hypothetical protein